MRPSSPGSLFRVLHVTGNELENSGIQYFDRADKNSENLQKELSLFRSTKAWNIDNKRFNFPLDFILNMLQSII